MSVADFFDFLLRRQQTEDLALQLAAVYRLRQTSAVAAHTGGAG